MQIAIDRFTESVQSFKNQLIVFKKKFKWSRSHAAAVKDMKVDHRYELYSKTWRTGCSPLPTDMLFTWDVQKWFWNLRSRQGRNLFNTIRGTPWRLKASSTDHKRAIIRNRTSRSCLDKVEALSSINIVLKFQLRLWTKNWSSKNTICRNWN